VVIIIYEKKSFAVTINDCYYTEPLKNSQSLGLFSDTEEIQDDRLRGLVEEALVFFENLFGVRLDAQQIENKKRHEVERKKLLDQL
jgi:Mor family transcriptional regulator